MAKPLASQCGKCGGWHRPTSMCYPAKSEAHQRVLFKTGNTITLRHGMKSAHLKAPLVRKFRGRIIEELENEDAHPELVAKLAESLAIVALGSQHIAEHGRESLGDRMNKFYDRHVRRRDNMCRALGVELRKIDPERRVQQQPKPEPLPADEEGVAASADAKPRRRPPDSQRTYEYPGLTEPKPEPTGVWTGGLTNPMPPPNPVPNPPMPPRLREVIAEEEREERNWYGSFR
jgi:hypothetical protein